MINTNIVNATVLMLHMRECLLRGLHAPTGASELGYSFWVQVVAMSHMPLCL